MPNKPKILLLPVTYHCNSRCIMCTIWERNGPHIEHDIVHRLFTDPTIIENLERLGLTGGEPTLNKDLVAILTFVVEHAPHLKEVSFNTHGFHTERVVTVVRQMAGILGPRGIQLSVFVSLDGIGEDHDRVRGIPGVYQKTMATIQECKSLTTAFPNLAISINATITCANADGVDELLKFSISSGIPVNFSLAIKTDLFFDSAASQTEFELTHSQRVHLRAFFKRLHRVSAIKEPNGFVASFYDHLLRMLDGNERILGCPFQSQGCLVEPNGDVYPCGKTQDLCMGNIREQTFTQIWESERAQAVWRALPNYCRDCESNCFVNAADHSAPTHRAEWLSGDVIPLAEERSGK